MPCIFQNERESGLIWQQRLYALLAALQTSSLLMSNGRNIFLFASAAAPIGNIFKCTTQTLFLYICAQRPEAQTRDIHRASFSPSLGVASFRRVKLVVMER